MSEANDNVEPTDPTDASPQMKVYIKPGCPWCTSALAWLEKEGYQFARIDVISSAEAFDEMVELSGQTLAPTMSYGDLVLADFGVPELEKFVDEHGIDPQS